MKQESKDDNRFFILKKQPCTFLVRKGETGDRGEESLGSVDLADLDSSLLYTSSSTRLVTRILKRITVDAFVIVYLCPQGQYKMCVNIDPWRSLGFCNGTFRRRLQFQFL